VVEPGAAPQEAAEIKSSEAANADNAAEISAGAKPSRRPGLLERITGLEKQA
jgi:hypothetical protein